MDSSLKQLFRQLTSASSPSGYETDAQNIFLKFISPYVNEITFDTLGNLVVKKRGSINKTIMFMAHADEVGFMIKYIEENGYIRISKIGGINISSLEGQRVIIHHHETHVKGIVGQMPVHMRKNKDEKKTDISDLWVDIGTNSKEETEQFVTIGDYMTFEPNFNELVKGKIVSKSIDDRVGLLVLAGVLRNLHNAKTICCNIVAVASVQEEIGLRGAKTASYNIESDKSVIIDVTHATDYPTVNKNLFGDIRLGSGVVVTYGPNFDKKICSELTNVAEKDNILYQKEAMPFASPTDASAVQISCGGRATGLISIPCRYMHSPSEIVSENDIDSAITLLTNYCIKVSSTI